MHVASAPLLGMTPDRLLLFICAELVFSLTPGPTVMMIAAYGLKGGFRDAVAAICGTQTGNMLWYLVCAFGLNAIFTASPTLFNGLRYLGAAYLVWLGASALWQSWHPSDAPRGPRLMGRPYVQATLTQLANPKALLFFGALVPQFLDTHAPLVPQYIAMAVITFIGESVVLTGYGWLAAAGGRIADPRHATHHAIWRERISGVVLIGIGLLVARP